ncbi:hypothetical protein ACT3CD_04100 [Geofilum sp. OHC36d9]|uniref:hypothetical protein n=1 Tax=Geofilum sp. OHC36d9 TaxID=3458413 RepID=UPI0040334B39
MTTSARISFLLLTSLLIACPNVLARKAKGFIINNQNDTIKGWINLPTHDFSTNAYYLSGFDSEMLHQEVHFKNGKKEQWQTYGPKQIKQFEFSYKNETITFTSFKLSLKSIVETDKGRERFLKLEYKGAVCLYKFSFLSPNKTMHPLNEKPEKNNEWYLISPTGDVIPVRTKEEVKNMHDLLQKAGIDNQYIQLIPANTNFKAIKSVLQNYDNWLGEHQNK